MIRKLSWEEAIQMVPGDKVLLPARINSSNAKEPYLLENFEEATIVEVYPSEDGIWTKRPSLNESKRTTKDEIEEGWFFIDELFKPEPVGTIERIRFL
jgi:hypothetical protein